MILKCRGILFFLAIVLTVLTGFSCRTKDTSTVTLALSEKFSGLDTLTTVSSDAAADRLRTLMFNSLVKKNEKYEYVGELAKDIKISDDNLTVTFTLQDNVKFHNGKPLTSADVKYTLDSMFQSNGYKALSFYDTVNKQKEAHIISLETPDPKTVVIKVRRPALVNQLLSNLVAVPIIPEGTAETQKTAPVGSGAYKFASLDSGNNIVALEAFPEYWEGAPKILKLNVKTVADANALQAEFQSGRVDLAVNPTNFSSDTFKSLSNNPNLQVIQTNGSNIRYLAFNVQNKPVDNVKLRQAIAYAIDREKIVKDLLGGQAQIANSVLPAESWAYTPGTIYNFDPAKAQQFVKESGYNGEKINFKLVAGNQAINQYSQVIQNDLKAAGINAEIETLELQTLLEQLKQGQFQMTTSQWVGGNQDPIFLKDLFASSESPDKKDGGRNRSRYSNPEFDKVVNEAVDTTDKTKAKELYAKAQEIISNDLPYINLWYPANMVVASKKLGNIKVNPSGDWSFVKDITIIN